MGLGATRMAPNGNIVEPRGAGTASTVRLPPVGFWSYARQDDQLSAGRLSALRALLMHELQQQYGREPIRLFQDANTIPHGSDWEKEIKKALHTATFFIPIVTPNFVQSEWCCREVELFMERERQLGTLHPELAGTSRIFPILFIGVDDVDPENPEMLAALQKLQWFDFRPFRHRDFGEADVREALSDLAGNMRSLLKRKVAPPAADPPPPAEPPAEPASETAAPTVRDRRREADQVEARAARLAAAGEAERRRAEAEEEAKAEAERERQAAKRVAADAVRSAAFAEKAAVDAPGVRPWRPWLLLGLAGAAITAAIVLFSGLLKAPEPSTPPSSSAPAALSGGPASVTAPASPSEPDRSWLRGRWCVVDPSTRAVTSLAWTISEQGGRIITVYPGGRQNEPIRSTSEGGIRTETATYARDRHGHSVTVDEPGFVTRLERCR